MIRRHITALRLSLMAADAFSALALFIVISIGRWGFDGWRAAWLRAGVDPIVLGSIYAATWVTVVWLQGLYRLRVRWSIRSEIVDVVRAGALLAVATFSALFILKLPEVSRLYLIVLFPSQVVLTMTSRLALRVVFRSARERGLNARFVLVVGTTRAAQAFADRIERHRELGLRVAGHLALGSLPSIAGAADPLAEGPTTLGFVGPRPILGTVEEIETILHSTVVDEVAICLPAGDWAMVEPITRLCEDEGKIVRIPLTEGVLMLPGARQEEFDGIPILSLVYGPDRIVSLVTKRILDIGLSAVALLILSPIYALLAVAVRLIDGGPILFTQVRVGLHGRPFQVVKFRTMVPDAEARLPELEARNEIQGHAFKVTDDPRLSRTGRFLRKVSLDELPQFWNVLKGEMSLVGPRPPLPTEVASYDIWHRRRLSMKPGITGLWQVAARREEDFDRWVAMDLDYIDRWSLWLDFKIMARTLPAMLQGR